MSERCDRLAAARLYLCSGGARPDLAEFLDTVLAAGVDVLQLREKDLDARPILETARTFRAACRRHGALFIVNDRADLAQAAEADGVHVGQDDLPPHYARALLGRDVIVGRSTHTREEITRSRGEPIDYIAVGPVFETPTKPGRAAVGLDLVRFAASGAAGDRAWFAIGGIDVRNVSEVAAAGARRIVVVRAITEAEDPAAAVRALRAALSND